MNNFSRRAPIGVKQRYAPSGLGKTQRNEATEDARADNRGGFH